MRVSSHKKHKFIFFLLVTLVPFCGSAYSQQQPPTPTAREILDRVASTYTSCRSYSDEGETTISINKGIGRPHRSHFTTTFVRAGGFRFQFDEYSLQTQIVLWKDADVEKYWISRLGELQIPFEEGLSRVAFASGGASLTVPTLLLTNLFTGRSFLDSFAEPKLNGVEKVDGHPAFVIEGNIRGQGAKVWIDQSSYLIVKSYRVVQFSNMRQEATTRYKPGINFEIAADKLVFKPPPPEKDKSQSVAPPGIAIAGLSMPEVSTEAPRLKRFGESLRMNPAQIDELRKKRSSSNNEDVIRVDTDLVVSEVLVLDAKGNSITGLLAKDFIVKEDSKVQEISSFSLGDASAVPRSIVLIMDYSGSELPYIETSVDAAKMLVDKLNPKDRMAIVSDDVKLLVDFTSNKETLKTTLELLRSRALAGKVGRSAQYDALIVSLRELFNEEDLRPIVIFQTDGDQLSLLKGVDWPNPDPYFMPKSFGLEDLKTASEKARATIYSIIPAVKFVGFPEDEQVKRAELDWQNRQKTYARLNSRPNPNSNKPPEERLRIYASQWLRRQLALVDVATYTGGWADYLEQPEQANEVYARVLSDINKRYVIGYYPTNKARDGKRRNVQIEVRDHPEYVVTGRRAYFAPQPE
jgi:VWFA-related protein